ncbi:hypothetical protein J7E94_27750 [Streptomyces sp. ISL-94]|nr:hypothetical protein [Streptomyces sp. ISL-94]
MTDGNQSTYWESAGSTFPQGVQTDLGAVTRVDQVVLKLPAAWESRSQPQAATPSTRSPASASGRTRCRRRGRGRRPVRSPSTT